MKEETEETKKAAADAAHENNATNSEPPAESKPVDVNAESEDAGKGKNVGEIVNSGLNAGPEEYVEARNTVSQQPEPQPLSSETLNALNKEQLAVLLQNYQAMLEKGEIEQDDFDQLRKDVESRI